MGVDTRLAEYRRYSDPRYYKGTEFADLIEACAEIKRRAQRQDHGHQRRQAQAEVNGEIQPRWFGTTK